MTINISHFMLDEGEKGKLERGFKVTTVLWASFLTALAIYLVIANMIPDVLVADHPKLPDPFAIVAYTLYAISIICLLLAFFMRRHLLRSNSIIYQLTSQTSPYISHPAAIRYNMVISLSISFCQSIGIFGLILRILNADFVSLYILVAVSAAALIFFRPKKNELYDLAVKMKKEQVNK